MSDNKIMPWIDELEGAAATDFPARRDESPAQERVRRIATCPCPTSRSSTPLLKSPSWK